MVRPRRGSRRGGLQVPPCAPLRRMASQIQKGPPGDFKRGQPLWKGASTEKSLSLVRIAGQTAFVCPDGRYREAVDNPEANIEVGVPLRDIRYASNSEAAN